MGDVFPELKHQENHIKEIIADEETSFGRTLEKVFPYPSWLSFSFIFGNVLAICGQQFELLLCFCTLKKCIPHLDD